MTFINKTKFLLPLLGLFTFSCIASEEDGTALSIERSISKDFKISFDNELNIQAKKSDFVIKNYLLMSNEEGERWALLTLKNESAGNRTFEHSHLIALFADGERREPVQFKQHFAGSEIASITLSFGNSKFPIVEIAARND